MTKNPQLSLWSAILVNINVMFGAGIFINTVTLAKMTGFLGFISYACACIFIIPLIFLLASLLRRYPIGGFYTYAAQDLHPAAGFLACWAYFVGKLASVAVLIHLFSSLIQTIVPLLAMINTFALDLVVLALFCLLNTLNMKTSRSILYVFLVLKVFPILFAILTCLYLYNHWTIAPDTFLWQGIPETLPLVLFAFAGFEVATAISRSIKDPEKNAPRSIFISFALVVVITLIYQFLIFLTVGTELMQQGNFLGIFPSLLNALSSNPEIQKYLIAILYSSLATASLGGAYGILFSNHWNLYTLASNGHTFYAHQLTKLNKHDIPVMCVLIEGVITVIYFFISPTSLIPLQQISVLGLSIAYCMSVIGVFYALYKGRNISTPALIPLASLVSCAIFVTTIIRNFIQYGIFPLSIFSILLFFGLCMYVLSKPSSYFKRHQSNKA